MQETVDHRCGVVFQELPPASMERRSMSRVACAMNRFLFKTADYLSSPPGFYAVIAIMILCTLLVPFGWTDIVTYGLSVAAIVITGVVLIQGFRDTAAIHAKLDEIIIALEQPRNHVVGLEHRDPEKIKEVINEIEERASQAMD